MDKPGLLLKSHGDRLTHGQEPYARDDGEWHGKDHSDLLSVIKEVKPHILLGLSTKPKAFTEEIVKEMAKHVDRPIIFPLSNPTRLHEADPKDINEWTEGKALIATGSPFPPVEYNGKKYEVGVYSSPLQSDTGIADYQLSGMQQFHLLPGHWARRCSFPYQATIG